MKKIIIFASVLLIASGISYGQKPIRRHKQEKTEQAQSTSSRQNQQQALNNKKKTQSSVKVSEPDGYINGHGYVDLGLPSGTKWATMNVGANSPSDYGNYYAWGETTTKTTYIDGTSLTYGQTMSELKSSGVINTACNLTMSYDAARANWGGTWRMPTKAEMDELDSKSQWLWTSQGGHLGYRVTGPNGKSIFVPAAGLRYDASLLNTGACGGHYWSSSCDDSSYSSYRLDFDSGSRYVFRSSRYDGRSVRPVSE